MSIEALQQALLNKAAERMETNEDSKAHKGIANVYDPPPGRKPGTLDAKWGDPPATGHNGYPDVYGDGARTEAKNVRTDMIERLFDAPASSAPAEQAGMNALFAYMNQSTPHSPSLQRGHLPEKVASSPDDETLSDRVDRIIGFR